jgi:hypothetical protein
MTSSALMFFGNSDRLPYLHLSKQGVMDMLDKPDNAHHYAGRNKVGEQESSDHRCTIPRFDVP